ncbi:MAG: hypothetical protein L0221_18685 [Chloroflexi bacterium]|nr:hypothetical protein [Chloroflexota bacterium]
MGFLDALKSLLGGGAATDRGALYLYVRCSRCGDVVRVRINMANELQQDFGEADGVAGYSLRKGVVDSKCFRPIQVAVKFDGRRRETSREIEGGEFVGPEEYEATRQSRHVDGA